MDDVYFYQEIIVEKLDNPRPHQEILYGFVDWNIKNKFNYKLTKNNKI